MIDQSFIFLFDIQSYITEASKILKKISSYHNIVVRIIPKTPSDNLKIKASWNLGLSYFRNNLHIHSEGDLLFRYHNIDPSYAHLDVDEITKITHQARWWVLHRESFRTPILIPLSLTVPPLTSIPLKYMKGIRDILPLPIKTNISPFYYCKICYPLFNTSSLTPLKR